MLLPLLALAIRSYPPRFVIGNVLASAPNGVAFVAGDSAGFVMDPGGDYFAGTAAPDGSYHHTQLLVAGAKVGFDWGRVGTSVIGRLISDKPVEVTFKLSAGWPGFTSKFTATENGADGVASTAKGEIRWRLHVWASPERFKDDELVIALAPGKEARLAAGFDPSTSPASFDSILDRAAAAYAAKRPAAKGDWGDFIGAIADNLNNSRLYASDDHRVAISVSRGWAKDVNNAPYFCWDSFFNGALSCLDDPATARETVRAILSWQTSSGLVPNYGHWIQGDGTRSSDDRSQPPVGAMCVWKIHQRWPNKAFLEEVYPKLLKWHRWWPTERDGLHDGLLEWGSSKAGFQGALWETGWDDTVQFNGAKMAGNTLNAYAVDLNSLWAMDAEYLAFMATVLDKPKDAQELRAERERTNKPDQRKALESREADVLQQALGRNLPDRGHPDELLSSYRGSSFARTGG